MISLNIRCPLSKKRYEIAEVVQGLGISLPFTRPDLKAGKQVVGCAHSLQCAGLTRRSLSPSARLPHEMPK
jgi:hypothetical protein